MAMSGYRPILGHVPGKVALVVGGLVGVAAPYRYIVDGPTAAFNVVFTGFLLLWLVGWAYAELHRAEMKELEEEHDLSAQK